MFNQKEKYRMRKTIIFTIVVSLLSFGMIDSATTSKSSEELWIQMVEKEELRKLEEKRLKRKEEYNITKMNLIDS